MTINRPAAVTCALLAAVLLQPLAALPQASAHAPGARAVSTLGATTSQAVWIDRDTIAWNGVPGAASTQLLYSLDGSLTTASTGPGAHRIRLGKTALTDV
ncbi:hypothetical protein, partial [Streptomyces sp. WELS2]|uniref:hypothetical protein n=1 Tax=Streptomyces sp. WELS2 TaxID=2749435 RepID=UPI0015F11BA1